MGDEVNRQQLSVRERHELEVAESQRKTKALVQRYEPIIAATLPKHLNGDRMARLVLNSCRKVPDLLEATPESLVGSVLSIAALGLDIDVAGEAWVIPFKDRKKRITEASPIIGYQGWSKLYYQHPLAADLAAHAVYEGDEFDYELGTDGFIRHKPKRGPLKDRGEPLYYYAIARLTNGHRHFEVLTPDEVRELRGGRTGPKGDIADPQRWMERKTVLRQVLKLAPRSTMVNHALTVDEKPGSSITVTQISEADEDRAQIEGPLVPPADGDPGPEPEGWTQ